MAVLFLSGNFLSPRHTGKAPYNLKVWLTRSQSKGHSFHRALTTPHYPRIFIFIVIIIHSVDKSQIALENLSEALVGKSSTESQSYLFLLIVLSNTKCVLNKQNIEMKSIAYNQEINEGSKPSARRFQLQYKIQLFTLQERYILK